MENVGKGIPSHSGMGWSHDPSRPHSVTSAPLMAYSSAQPKEHVSPAGTWGDDAQSVPFLTPKIPYSGGLLQVCTRGRRNRIHKFSQAFPFWCAISPHLLHMQQGLGFISNWLITWGIKTKNIITFLANIVYFGKVMNYIPFIIH